MSPEQEERFAAAWRTLARQEGHRGRLPAATATCAADPAELTARDYEILRLLDKGSRDAYEIADALGLSRSAAQVCIIRLVRLGRLQRRRPGAGAASERYVYSLSVAVE